MQATQTNVVSQITESQANEWRSFGKAYAAHAVALQADDEEFAHVLAPLNYQQWEACRLNFIQGASTAGYKAADKLWERTIKRLGEFHGIEKPKAESAKAQQMAAKREAAKAADQKALEVIAKAKGLNVETAKPEQLLQLAADPKLTTANKKILVDAAIRKEKEQKREAEKAGNEADKALREEAREILKGFHGAQLAKALAALKKIK